MIPIPERLGEAFAAETVSWVGGLWGRGRAMESLDSDGLTLYITDPLTPVFIGLQALLTGENDLKRVRNTGFRVKELESDPIVSPTRL